MRQCSARRGGYRQASRGGCNVDPWPGLGDEYRNSRGGSHAALLAHLVSGGARIADWDELEGLFLQYTEAEAA